ncbi:hypothetical protein VTK56DRAFT_3344 [Thermocarpiscus australiensis]
MPAVNVAMERSLRGGFLDLLVASLRPALERRNVQEQITDVKTAFSSWDNCMQANYCKWPAIALIIIGGLIIFSVTWCIVRCACCGLSCCCSCFSCLKCCGDCCGCCDPPRGSRRKYLDEPYIPPDQGYKSQAPMHTGFGNPMVPAAKGRDVPQYAEFDVGKKNEDALPEMPSWEGAGSKKVLVEEEAVEMNALKKPEDGGQNAAAINGAPAARAVSPNASRSPVNRSPYGPPSVSSPSNGYYATGSAESDPYAQGASGYHQPGLAYSQSEQGYGIAGTAMGPGRESPHPYNRGHYNDGYDHGSYGQAGVYPSPTGQGSYDHYGAARQQPYDNHNSHGPPSDQGYGIARQQSPQGMDAGGYPPDPRRSPAPQGQYGAYSPNPRQSPAPQADYALRYGTPVSRRSPAPQAEYGGYESSRPYPSRQYSSESTQPLRAPPQRQYSANDMSATGPHGPAPLRNDAGFNFSASGYSRPATAAAADPGSGYRMPSPSFDRQPQQSAYPGFKPYQPPA